MTTLQVCSYPSIQLQTQSLPKHHFSLPNINKNIQIWSLSLSLHPLSHTLLFSHENKRNRHFGFQLPSSTAINQAVASHQDSEEEEYCRNRLLASNVPWTCTPQDIRSLFEKHGKVIDVQLSMHNKNRNRGLAFVTMGSDEEALTALSNLESYEFEGRALRLNYAKLKKKKPTSIQTPRPVLNFRLFVGNLSFEASAHHLMDFFGSETGGDKVMSAEVVYYDSPMRSAGYGFVSFKSKKAAEAALTEFQGKVFMGRPLLLGRAKRYAVVQTDEVEHSEDISTSELNSELNPENAEYNK